MRRVVATPPVERTSRASSRRTRAGEGPRAPATDSELKFRLEVFRHLGEHRDEVVADMMAAIDKQVPEYKAISDRAVRADIRRAVQGVVSVALSVLAESRRLSADEIGMIRSIGARRSQQGLAVGNALSAIAAAIKIGLDLAVEYAAEVRAPDGVAQKVTTAISRDFLDFQAEVHAAAVAGYHEDQARRTAGRREQTELFQEVLAGSCSGDEFASRAVTMGHDLTSTQRMVVLVDDRMNLRVLQKAGENFLKAVPTAMGALMGVEVDSKPHMVIVVSTKAAWVRALEAVQDTVQSHPVTALLSREIQGPQQLYEEYQETCDLIGFAVEECGLHRAVEADRLLARWYLENSAQRADRFLEKTIGPVLAQERASQLMKVLEARLAGEKQSLTARRLRIAERTVRSNQEDIRRLTGLNVKVRDQRFLLELAIHTCKTRKTGK